MRLNIQKENHIMNTSNITNYKPKDFAELLGISVKTLQHTYDQYFMCSPAVCMDFVSIKNK
nr:MAG TPA: helix-turn-helix domain protein [Bacteriophage sp.]DAW65755.1 MAG TPA: helix-turn-helix domain protein [Bacteriophage sp.]